MSPDEANVKGQELANEIAPLLADLSIVGKHITKALLQAVEAEREACAEIAEKDDSFMMFQDWGLQNAVTRKGQNIAATIRARGKNND